MSPADPKTLFSIAPNIPGWNWHKLGREQCGERTQPDSGKAAGPWVQAWTSPGHC